MERGMRFWPDVWHLRGMRACLLLVLLLLAGPALHAQGRVRTIETDSGRVVLHFFTTGQLSTVEWTDKDGRFGRSRAFKRDGTVIADHHTRWIAGHASVHFEHHPNGAVSRCEFSDAPDAGIQWYRSVSTFDEQGNRTGFTEESNELLERTFTQPIEPLAPTEAPVRKPEVAICQKLFVNEVFLVNTTRQAGKATVKALRPSPVLRDSEHTLAPGDTVRLGNYSVGERCAAPDTELTVEVRRALRNRRKPAAPGVLRTDNAPVDETTQRWYLVVHRWAPGRSTPKPGTR
jgi:hypothetical protein